MKAFLAGQRGICPECEARFIVPAEGGGRVTPLEETVAAPQSASPPVPPPAPEASPEVNWYVRTAEAGQFGPTDTATIRTWVAEGRVPADGWVWRTGWPDWKRGADAFPLMEATQNESQQQGLEPPAEPVGTETAIASLDTARSNVHLTRRRSRRQRARRVTTLLSVIVIVLIAVLILVLSLQN